MTTQTTTHTTMDIEATTAAIAILADARRTVAGVSDAAWAYLAHAAARFEREIDTYLRGKD